MSNRGWLLVVGAFTVAWTLTLASNLGGGPDGGLYPMTAYPMFSASAPSEVSEYHVQADGNASQRLGFSLAFDEERQLRGTLLGPVARTILRLIACDTAACAEDLASVVQGMRPILQARLGLSEPPSHLQLVVVTRNVADPGAVTEAVHEMA